MKRTTTKHSGQGMTEYVIAVVLIAIAVLAAVQVFGLTLWSQQVGATTTVGAELEIDVR